MTAQSLKCWNCVGSDCDTYRKDYSNWGLEECAEGAQCQVFTIFIQIMIRNDVQTTHYTFHSNELNETFFGIVTRSCSYETGSLWKLLLEDSPVHHTLICESDEPKRWCSFLNLLSFPTRVFVKLIVWRFSAIFPISNILCYFSGCMPNKMTRSCLNNVNMMVGAGCYQRECCMTDGCNTKWSTFRLQ